MHESFNRFFTRSEVVMQFLVLKIVHVSWVYTGSCKLGCMYVRGKEDREMVRARKIR